MDVFTGSTGCSGVHSDSKPNSSARRAKTAMSIAIAVGSALMPMCIFMLTVGEQSAGQGYRRLGKTELEIGLPCPRSLTQKSDSASTTINHKECASGGGSKNTVTPMSAYFLRSSGVVRKHTAAVLSASCSRTCFTHLSTESSG